MATLPLVPADVQRYVHLMVAPVDDQIRVETSKIAPGYLRVAAFGVAGIGSDGNRHGDQLRDAIQRAIDDSSPQGVLVDLRQLEYRSGNYVCSAILGKDFPTKRMCVLARGASFTALHELWESSRFDKLLPLFDDESDAIAYVTR